MLERILPFLSKLSRRSDLVVAVLMLVAVTMMLIPLPTWLVDILITANIAFSVLILLAALYVTHPLQFSSLPSVILLATLFRLAITITTTRLILLQADAGEIVTAFGAFVVGGSIAVGLVIFLIITVAQFVVIAKGAERVAEVAARFMLDALPGKQMSIDAELRNGDIDQAEARRLRKQLEHESQLYGAMDGAMKFVKGDVIAGILIILVNLIGGFAVGTLQRGMSLGDAMQTYSLLTVGDGLVAQIPALLISVASGTMITRVTGAEDQGDLGRQITGQLLRDARTLTFGAVILVALSLVPGFPSLVFLILGAILGAGAYGIYRRPGETKPVNVTPSTEDQDQTPADAEPRPLEYEKAPSLPAPDRIVVWLGNDLGNLVPKAELSARCEQVRAALKADLGIEVPSIGTYVDDGIESNRMRVDLEGAPILSVEAPRDQVLVTANPTDLELLEVPYTTGSPVAGRQKPIWVESRHVANLAKANLGHLQHAEFLGQVIEHALRGYADHFIGIQETRKLLSSQEDEYADLVREAQEIVPLQKLSEILRRLVAEDIPINNLRIILEALIEWGQREKDAALLCEYVRIALRRQISFRMADRDGIIAAYILQPSAEEALRKAVQNTSAGGFVNIGDDEARFIAQQIEEALSKATAGTAPVVLTGMDVRRHVRSLLTRQKVKLPVLSYQELAPELNVQPLATITSRQQRVEARERPKSLPAAQT
ncbi:type III secretion system export apparatus subunit SctV [Chelativorans sp. YIM 93263]|uniref:type III secretion system export apparatus subunit SctV n=1 Tax=Chelativorans sp. YIM 93263 TaxID=2906648 RepID=UPI002377E854|nr:type III secretion system export apparatus subunit SctV [Chelativorans sp. YIM 93263]